MGGSSAGGGNPYLTMAMTAAQMLMQKQAADKQARSQSAGDDLQAQSLWQEQDQRAKQQRDLLKRQMASARAALAGGGIGFGGGSGAALLSGMAKQTEQNIADGYDSTNLRHQIRFGSGERNRVPAEGLFQGLQMAQQGMSLFRPNSNSDSD